MQECHVACEPWMDDILNSTPDFRRMSTEATRDVLVQLMEAGGATDAAIDILAEGALPDILRRMMQVGIFMGRVMQERTRSNAAGSATPIPGHPDLSEMIDRIEVRRPDVRLPHAYAQIALLEAIRRLSDTADNVADVHLLADAYITLPPPGEDAFREGAEDPE